MLLTNGQEVQQLTTAIVAPMPKQTERTRATKGSIVDAATTAFVEVGSIDVSLDAIAERAGVAKSTLLYHFDSRTGLLQRVAAELFRDLVGRVEASAGEDLETWVRQILAEQAESSAVVLHRIGDELLQLGQLNEIDPLVPLTKRFQNGGAGDRSPLLAAAMYHFGREIAYGKRRADDLDDLLGQLA